MSCLTPYGIIDGIVPTGGSWRYDQLHEGIPVELIADDADELVNEVREFRARAHIPIGDVELDVSEFIKNYSPQNNRFPKRHDVLPNNFKPADKKPLIRRIGDWLLENIARKPQILRVDEAREKAARCIGCPQNVAWKTKCSPCNVEVEDRGRQLRRRVLFDDDPKLRACRLHDLYLPAAVFVDRSFLPEVDPRAPDFCFLRQSI